MKKPPTQTMVVGHPLVAVPGIVSGVTGLLASLYGGGDLFVVLVCGVVTLGVARAHAEAAKYRAWNAEWDAMSGDPPRRSNVFKNLLSVVLAIVLLWGGYAACHAHLNDVIAYAILFGGPLLALFALVTLVRWLRYRRRRAPRDMPVRVVATAILPVPTLAAAYAALPDYCQRLLGSRG